MSELEQIKMFLREWDPIHIIPDLLASGNPPDEYDSYAPHIHTMLQSGCSAEDIAKYLDKLLTVDMGLKTKEGIFGTERRLAENIVEWWQTIRADREPLVFDFPYTFRVDKTNVTVYVSIAMGFFVVVSGLGYLIATKQGYTFLYALGGMGLFGSLACLWFMYVTEWNPWELTIDAGAITAKTLFGGIRRIDISNIKMIDKSFDSSRTAYFISDARSTIRCSTSLVDAALLYRLMEGYIKPHFLRRATDLSPREEIVATLPTGDKILIGIFLLFGIAGALYVKYDLSRSGAETQNALLNMGIMWAFVSAMALFTYLQFKKFMLDAHGITFWTPHRSMKLAWSEIQTVEYKYHQEETGNTSEIVLRSVKGAKLKIPANNLSNFGRLEAIIRNRFHHTQIDLLADAEFARREQKLTTEVLKWMPFIRIISIGMILYGGYYFVKGYPTAMELKSRGISTAAKITAKANGEFEYEFEAAGKPYRDRARIQPAHYTKYDVGNEIRVTYLPDTPAVSRVREMGSPILFAIHLKVLLYGLFLFLLSEGMALYRKRKLRKAAIK